MLFKGYEWSDKKFTWVFESAKGSPVIITVPHDRGFYPHEVSGFFKPREKGVKGRDAHVWPIVRDILLEVRVNAVRGLFPRRFIDYNRSIEGINYCPFSQKETETAFDDVGLGHIYDYYHRVIAELLEKAIQTYGKEKCLLVDFHGFTKQPSYGEYDLILGTGNRITVRSHADQALADFFSARGYKIFLPGEGKIGPQEDTYSADFTTRHYAKTFGIDAIQIEVAKRFRVFKGKEIGQKLSADMAEFFELQFDL